MSSYQADRLPALPLTRKRVVLLYPGVGWVERLRELSAGSAFRAQPIVHLQPHLKMGYGAPDRRE